MINLTLFCIGHKDLTIVTLTNYSDNDQDAFKVNDFIKNKLLKEYDFYEIKMIVSKSYKLLI